MNVLSSNVKYSKVCTIMYPYIGKELILQIIDYDIPCKDALLCSNLT